MLRISVLCGFALVLLGALTMEVAAQTACSGWYPICKQRCVAQNINCGHCEELMATCKKSGCWREGKNYGRKLHCNLKKS